MYVRLHHLFLVVAIICLCLTGAAFAQQDDGPMERLPTADKSAPPPQDNRKSPPHSSTSSDDSDSNTVPPLAPDESSSKQSQIDVSPPSTDAADHPHSMEADTGDIDEFKPYNPMKAMKNIEVGDFYYKQENYPAAISRYQEALEFKPSDAEATFKLAQAQDKNKDLAQAAENYRAYLKILPNGPYAKQAKKQLEKLKDQGTLSSSAPARPSN